MRLMVIDSAIAGLGGFPNAKGASGNVATEDLLYILDGMGTEMGVDRQNLLEASAYISVDLNRDSASRAGALTKK
jgi:hydroxymethylglutaryl-CoA lyase